MSLSVQFQTMLAMTAMGVWIGLSVDTYGRFFPRRRKPLYVTLFLDVLFWTLQSLLVFYVLLFVNEGIVRFYLFLALFCGYAAYQALFRSIYIIFLERTIRFCNSLARFSKHLFVRLVLQPIRWLLQLASSCAMMILGLVGSFFSLIFKFGWKLVRPLVPSFVFRFFYKIQRFFGKWAGFFKNMKNQLKKVGNDFRQKLARFRRR